jgi:hypothetical protein
MTVIDEYKDLAYRMRAPTPQPTGPCDRAEHWDNCGQRGPQWTWTCAMLEAVLVRRSRWDRFMAWLREILDGTD